MAAAPCPRLDLPAPDTTEAVTVAALIAIPFVGLFLSRTRIGKSMRALANEPELAAVSGIDTDRIAVYTWALAGGRAGAIAAMRIHRHKTQKLSFRIWFGLVLLVQAAAVVLLIYTR